MSNTASFKSERSVIHQRSDKFWTDSQCSLQLNKNTQLQTTYISNSTCPDVSVSLRFPYCLRIQSFCKRDNYACLFYSQNMQAIDLLLATTKAEPFTERAFDNYPTVN